jgi:catechol 2,3-dioxygenase-like lactoylglutathione lyase family enzyme
MPACWEKLSMTALKIDHIQVAIPAGRLPDALAFYTQVLFFLRVPKPAELDQSGAWLISGPVNLHLGEEADFTASPRAHPALLVDNFAEIIEAARRCNHPVRIDAGPTGYLRASVFDPFGNRIEVMQLDNKN